MIPSIRDGLQNELTESMWENCKQSLPGVQGIIEATMDDEGLLIEAFSLHDELQKVISRYEQVEAATESGGGMPNHDGSETQQHAEPDRKEANSSPHDENGIAVESREFAKVETTTEPSSELPRTVASEKDGVAGTKERVVE